jgi:hypothetical protein
MTGLQKRSLRDPFFLISFFLLAQNHVGPMLRIRRKASQLNTISANQIRPKLMIRAVLSGSL